MWKQDESGRVHTPLEPVVLAATLALIPVLIIEADATSEGWQRFAEAANWGIWAIFVIELVAVLVVATRKKAALRAHWLDVAIVVLTVPLLGKALAWLRLARFIRLARFGVIVARALQAERRLTSGDSLRIAALLTLTAIVVGGAAQNAVAAGDREPLGRGLVGGGDGDDGGLRRHLPEDRRGQAGRDGADVRGHWLPLPPHRCNCVSVREARESGRARRGDGDAPSARVRPAGDQGQARLVASQVPSFPVITSRAAKSGGPALRFMTCGER